MKHAAALFLVALLFSGCHANLTPVANLADYATQVTQTAGLVLQAAQTAQATINPVTGKMLITTPQLDAVALACDKIGREATTLAKALTDYNAAKTAGTSTALLSASIQGLVGDAVNALQTIGKAIPSGTVAQIDSAVTSALGLYAQIQALAL